MINTSEDQLIRRYGYFVYYDALWRYEEDNPGQFFDFLNDNEKIRLLDSELLHSLR